jgi:hypothetical protein
MQFSSGRTNVSVLAVTILRLSRSICVKFVQINLSPVACFVNGSTDVAFRIAFL